MRRGDWAIVLLRADSAVASVDTSAGEETTGASNPGDNQP